ncbi:MAG: Arc family DNA-binding protein [Maricaulaceae bacterium]
MAAKKSYPLRINAEILAAVQRWADDDLRSVNAQIEFLLREALKREGRWRAAKNSEPPPEETPD